MNVWTSALHTFIGAGSTSAFVGYLAGHVDQIIAAIFWTYPFTLIIPLYSLRQNNKSNKFLSNFVYKQTYALILLVIFLLSTGYFLGESKPSDGVITPLLKSSGVWMVSATLFYIIIKLTGLGKHF